MYHDDGWTSWPDFIGYKRVKAPPGSMLPFTEARAFVWKLKLGGETEFREWKKSGQRPFNIPAAPARAYRDDGWVSMPDWLGYEAKVIKRKDMISFTAARAIVRKLM